MNSVYVAASITVLLGVLVVLRRVIVGPTVHDRILAVNVIGTKTIVLLLLVGFLYGRPGFFLDIALAYALINFIATVAVLRYMERRAQLRAAGEIDAGTESEG